MPRSVSFGIFFRRAPAIHSRLRAPPWINHTRRNRGSSAPATAANAHSLAVLLAASAGAAVAVATEWTADGLVPLTVFLPDRVLDIGPRADPSFVSAA